MKRPTWYIYMVRCQDFSLYTGISTDVENRVKAHNEKKGSRSVIAHGVPVSLVYMEEAVSYSDALRKESAIKRLKKKEKEALIRKK